MTKKTLISNLTTYAEARKKAVEHLLTLPADAKFHACRNRPWRNDIYGAGRVRILTHTQLEEAFPAEEEMVEEYFDVSVFKGDKYLGGISLFPQTSYVCENMSWLLFPKEEDEDEYEDDDRGYDSEDNYRSDDEPAWQRNCTCDASGPYWCSCRRDDDDY